MTEIHRFVVVGSSGTGKTTFATEVSKILDIPHIELDALHHLENWTPRPPDELAAIVDDATSQESWVVDGNYLGLQDVIWPKASHLVWLNFGFPLVFSRGLRRTLKRIVTKEELFSGNRETWGNVFFSRDSVLYYTIAVFRKRRRTYRSVFDGQIPWSMQKTELISPQAAESFLDTLRQSV